MLKLSPICDNMQEVNMVNNQIHLPEGLIGLPDVKDLEILYDAEQLPLMWLRDVSSDDYAFLVINPHGLIPNYTIELSDMDVEYLDIRSSSDILLLNIITVNCEREQAITVNLVGPILINRRTGLARQVIIENYQEYSTYHPLIADNRTPVAIAN
jgi:flagellar assembly factor FliW